MATAYLEEIKSGSYQKLNVAGVIAGETEQERLQPNNKQNSISHKDI